MPTYDFHCPKCGLDFEVQRPFSRATEPAKCPTDGAEAERVGLAYRCVAEDELLDRAQQFARGASSAPRELAIVTKRTIQAMADIDTHQEAVAHELEPQLWSAQQPWFAERLAALQAKISKR